MLVAIEGMDGSGKTTLVNALRTSLPFRIGAYYRPAKPGNKQELMADLVWVSTVPDQINLIVDRHPYISESIYGPVLRGTSQFDSMSEATRGLLLQRIAGVVYCRPSAETILSNNRASRDRQLPGVIDNTYKLLGAYDRFMSEFRGQVLWYDYEGDDISRIITGVIEWKHQTALRQSSNISAR